MISPKKLLLGRLFPGVYSFKDRKWRVQIRVRGRVKHLGYYSVLSNAVIAFNEAAKEHYDGLSTWWTIRKLSSRRKLGTHRPIVPDDSIIVPVDEEERNILDQLFGEKEDVNDKENG